MRFYIADKQHIEQIIPLFRELEEYYFGDKAASHEAIRRYFNERVFSELSGVSVILAEDDTAQIVGFATISILYPAPKLSGQIYLKDLFTSAKVRGQGIGKQLMKFIARFALEHGCNRLDWTAETTNPTAGEFYHAIGATLIEEKQYFRFEGENLRLFAES